MNILVPDWNQKKPSVEDVKRALTSLDLRRITLPEKPFTELLERLRATHSNGGAHIVAFDVGPSLTFDWYASRNRWAFDGVIDFLLVHPGIRAALPELEIPDECRSGLTLESAFLIDGRIAQALYAGGAYGSATGDGQKEKQLALLVCDAMFGLRFSEVEYDVSYSAWAPWFHGIAWDLTFLVFDKRMRRLWLMVITDTD
jgi:hypothetical protein